MTFPYHENANSSQRKSQPPSLSIYIQKVRSYATSQGVQHAFLHSPVKGMGTTSSQPDQEYFHAAKRALMSPSWLASLIPSGGYTLCALQMILYHSLWCLVLLLKTLCKQIWCVMNIRKKRLLWCPKQHELLSFPATLHLCHTWARNIY